MSHGTSLRFPYELISKIVREVAVFNDIETLRTLSRLKIEEIQRAIDEHIIALVINYNNDDHSSMYKHMNSPKFPTQKYHEISRTKLHLNVEVNADARSHSVSTLFHGVYGDDRHVDLSQSIKSHRDYHAYLRQYKLHRALVSQEDGQRIMHYTIVLIELYDEREGCSHCDERMGQVVLYMELPLPESALDRASSVKVRPPWFHLQLFKALPEVLRDDLAFNTVIGSPRALWDWYPYPNYTVHPDDFVITEWDDSRTMSPFNLTTFFEADFEKINIADNGDELVVRCPKTLYKAVVPDKTGSNLIQRKKKTKLVRAGKTQIIYDGGNFSTVDVFFYVSDKTLRSNFRNQDIYEKNCESSAMISHLNKSIYEILRLKRREWAALKRKNKALSFKVTFMSSADMKFYHSLFAGDFPEPPALQSFIFFQN